MSEPTFSASILVHRAPADVYAMVSDVTRMGQWSPICTGGRWDDGDGPHPGAWFTGFNHTPDRTWETRSQVAVAEPGREFTFVVGGAWVRWSYTLLPEGDDTRLTETWTFLAAGQARFRDRYGDDAVAEVSERTAAARRGIPETLAAIKAAAERGR